MRPLTWSPVLPLRCLRWRSPGTSLAPRAPPPAGLVSASALRSDRTPPGRRNAVHVGQTGTVVTRIRGQQGPGEVRVVHRGVPHTFIAYAAEPLPVGLPVLVIAM